MNTWSVALVVCLSVVGSEARAEGANPFAGEWVVEMHDAGGSIVPAADNIVLAMGESGGTYVNRSHNILRAATCSRTQGDVEDINIAGDIIQFTVVRSKRVASCPDFRIAFEKQSDESLSGYFVSMKHEGQRAGSQTLVAHRRK